MVVGCDLPGRPDPAARPVPEDRVESFEVLFGQNCAGCHGAEGKLGPAPPLNDSLFRAIISEKDLEQVITSGRPGTPMAAFARERAGTLTAAQIRVLIYEIKGIRYKVVSFPGGSSPTVEVARDPQGVMPKWGMPTPRPEDVPRYALEPGGDAKRGMQVFARACARCHGDHGQGEKTGGRWVRTIHDPVFLSLISDQALRRYAITGRPDLGMPDYAGKTGRTPDFKPLTPAELNDLVALLAAWRQEGSVNGQ
jgi:mono/diheme cytochrome c family protein